VRGARLFRELDRRPGRPDFPPSDPADLAADPRVTPAFGVMTREDRWLIVMGAVVALLIIATKIL
jgi:hypothetical protein